MSRPLIDTLQSKPVVPLVESADPAVAVAISKALLDGGLAVIEVVLRTDRALDCVRAIAAELPEVMVGAGTVLSADQADAAVDAGAQFIVSPGLDEGVVAAARGRDVPVLPGIATATELQRANNLGLGVVKFFPASIAGGVPALKALSGVFRTMRFMPTGGISAANLAEYLAVPSVLACGGSWLTPADAVKNGDYAAVRTLASNALAIAGEAKGLIP